MRVHFDESLRHLFPEMIEVAATSVLSALKGICDQHPLAYKIKRPKVYVRDFTSNVALTSVTTVQDVYVVALPESYSGSGGSWNKAGRMQIGLAVLFVALSFMGVPPQFAFSLRMSAATMAIGGAIAWLAPQPDTTADVDKKSRYFSGDKTTTKIGTPIQMTFGRRLVFAQLISFNINALHYDGLEDPKGSPYFKEKADTSVAEANINKFYGIINAGTTEVIQVDSRIYRTGSELV